MRSAPLNVKVLCILSVCSKSKCLSYNISIFQREQKNETSLICNACFTRLFAAFNFKSVCTDTEDCIMSYINSENRTPVDLREIYSKERQNEQLKGISGDERICRLCMQLTYEFTSAKNIDLDTFHTYIPEIVSTLLVFRNNFFFKW